MVNECLGKRRLPRARARVLVPIIVVGLLLVGGALYIISPVPPPTPYGEKTTRGQFLDQFLKRRVRHGEGLPTPRRHNSFHDLLIAARLWNEIDDEAAQEMSQLFRGELPEVSPELRDHVQRNEQPLAIVKKAVKETCTMPPVESLSDRLPHLAAFRDLARGLTTRAGIRELDGGLEGAYEDYLDVLRLGNCSAQGEVGIIHGLVGIAIHSIGARAMEPGIRSLDEPLLRQVIAGLQEAEGGMASLKGVLKGEFKVLEKAMEYIMEGRGNYSAFEDIGAPPPLNARDNILWLYVLLNKGRIRKNFQKFKATTLEYADTPISESRPPLSQLEQEIENSDHINKGLLPAIMRANDQWAICRTRIRGLKLRAAVELYERREGKYPKRLEDLVEAGIISAIPDDPFDGQKFRYIPSPEGGKIYSVATDLVDDKAEVEWHPGKEGGRGTKGDWVF